jgi:REP element-mobilizing transposase RayT
MNESPGWHTRGYLPHFDDGRLIQIVTFRLADSLPVAVLEKLEEQALDDVTRRTAIERYLDEGMGTSLMLDPGHAAAVCGALHERDGLDYRLHAWVIMPNHVHALLEPLANVTLGEIVGAWKSVSARKIMRSSPGSADALVRHRTNADEGVRAPRRDKLRLWQPDYFDRFIRDARHYRAAVDYIHQNPVVAGLVAAPDHWPWSSAAPLSFTSTRTALGTSRPSRYPPARSR